MSNNFKCSRELTIPNLKKYVNEAKECADFELERFISVCKAKELDPFLKDVYILKYKGRPPFFHISKDAVIARARKFPDYAGHEVIFFDAEGNRKKDPVGQIAGACCNVYIKHFAVPINASALISEYASGTPIWRDKPSIMISKVAIVMAHRHAYPEAFGGLYETAELDNIDPDEGNGSGGASVDIPPPEPTPGQGETPSNEAQATEAVAQKKNSKKAEKKEEKKADPPAADSFDQIGAQGLFKSLSEAFERVLNDEAHQNDESFTEACNDCADAVVNRLLTQNHVAALIDLKGQCEKAGRVKIQKETVTA